MRTTDLALAAYHGIRGNIMRSVFAVSMVVLGVGSVIILVAVGNGTAQQINDQVASLGASSIDVFPAPSATGEPVPVSPAAIDALTASPAASDIDLVAPVATTTIEAAAGPHAANLIVHGTTADIFTIKQAKVLDGRLLRAGDEHLTERVAVLDRTAASALFPSGPAVGETIVAGSTPLRVIGVVAEAEAAQKVGIVGGVIYTPLASAQGAVLGYDKIDSIAITATDPAHVDAAMAQTTAILMARAPDPGSAIAPTYYSPRDVRNALDQTDTSLQNMLTGVAAISLIVGGAGVTNVMMLSVRERTREIGIRRALGARRRSITAQFLLEALLLCLLGGAIGIAASVALTNFEISGVTPVLDGATIAIAAGLSVAVGVIFGTYPAARASTMDPVKALRVTT